MKGISLLLGSRSLRGAKKLLTGSLIAIAISTFALAAWARHHNLQVWAPDAAQLSKLAEMPSNISDYSIQAPPGWDSQLRGGPGKIGTEFDGPNDENSNHPFLMVMVMGLPNWGIDKRTPADFLDLRVTNIKRMVNNWKATKDETGVINGIPFARLHFTGTSPREGNPVEGFMYVGREGTYVCEIQAMYLTKNAKDTGPLLDAAAMTFKKQVKPMAAVETKVALASGRAVGPDSPL